MKVSYRWLQDSSSEAIGTPDEIADRLAQRGFPVEEARSLSVGLEGIVVAQVQTVAPHPDADRLSVCEVDDGNQVVQVICGAPNVEPGGFYPFAPVGTSLPSGLRIRKVKLRGQISHGMLCSENELDLGTDADGIMALEGTLEPGQPLVAALDLDDLRLDIEVTANRPDLLSHLGIVREIVPGGDQSAIAGELPGAESRIVEALEAIEVVVDDEEARSDQATIRIEAPDLCLRYLGLHLSGVEVGPSPRWLQARLLSIGARPINNVVDATNYVLHESGQPLHAFDLDLVEDCTVVIRRASEGESLRTLDRIERTLTPDMLAICDATRPIAVAGVMGGADSEVSGTTTDVLLECALFLPSSIRATRKDLGLSTEASYRFERGVDPEGLRGAMLRTALIILSTAGGEVRGPLLDVCPGPFARQRIPLRLERIERLLGMPFASETVHTLLKPLGLRVQGDAPRLDVEVPGFRSYDLTREVDLIEEVARTRGYDAFPDALSPFRTGSVPDHPLFELEDSVRTELVAWGLLEAQVPAFSSEEDGQVEVLNPVSAEESRLRNALLPGLVSRLEYNLSRGNRDVRLFELGTAFFPGEPSGLPREEPHVAGVLHGRRAPMHWSGPGAHLDEWDLKGLLERLTAVASAGSWSLRPGLDGFARGSAFQKDAAFRVVDSNGTVRGVGGALLPHRIDLPRWAGEVWGFEIELPAEPAPSEPFEARVPPMHEGSERDLALLVPLGVTVEEVMSLLRAQAGRHLRETLVFDVYRGDEIRGDATSVAIRMRFRASDRTLRDEEVDEAVRTVTRALQEELSVGIRGQ